MKKLKSKIKQLFCKHEYRLIDTVRYHGGEQNGHIEFRAYCRKCGKPNALRCVERSGTDVQKK